MTQLNFHFRFDQTGIMANQTKQIVRDVLLNLTLI